MSDRLNELQAKLYNASRILSRLTQEPVVKNSSSSDDPVDLEDLAEIADAISKAVDPVFKMLADYGDLECKVLGLFDDLCANQINDYVSSGLRSKATNIREGRQQYGPNGIGSNEADERHKLRREPAI
jgi:hypothetical protein